MIPSEHWNSPQGNMNGCGHEQVPHFISQRSDEGAR